MESSNRTSALALMLAAAAALSGCATLRIERVYAGSLAPAAAAELISRGEAAVIDLRPESEFRRGHLPGAVSVPVRKLGEWLTRLPAEAETPILVYDENGRVSDEAALWLVDQGYDSVSELAGGLEAWQGARLPVVPESRAGSF